MVDIVPVISYPGKHLMSALNPTANPLAGVFVMSIYGTSNVGAGH